MLFRYLRLNFLCWFGGIFAIVGQIVWSVAIFGSSYYQATNPYDAWLV